MLDEPPNRFRARRQIGIAGAPLVKLLHQIGVKPNENAIAASCRWSTALLFGYHFFVAVDLVL
jgi:hypothetical protein